MPEIIDFTGRARQAVRDRRRACDHDYRAGRSGVLTCAGCGDQFPCHGFTCLHLDCITRGVELGRRAFPRNFPLSVSELNKHHSSPQDDCPACTVDPDHHFRMRTSSDPPETWILPEGWSLSK